MSMGSVFENYNPEGAMNGLFAPAYIKGYAPSEEAVAAWTAANRSMTPEMVEASRMPNPVMAQDQGMGRRQGGIPLNQSYGDPRGAVDPEALRVLAQGGKYDPAARRDAIAQRMATNAATQQQQALGGRPRPPDWYPDPWAGTPYARPAGTDDPSWYYGG